MGKIENDIYVYDQDLNMETKQIAPLLRLTLKREEKFFGPGVATLLHLIEKTGTIQSACEQMGMSYSKAWKILKRADKELGFSLLNSQNGGLKGGMSELSEEGKAFLLAYDSMTQEMKEQEKRLFEKYFKPYVQKPLD